MLASGRACASLLHVFGAQNFSDEKVCRTSLHCLHSGVAGVCAARCRRRSITVHQPVSSGSVLLQQVMRARASVASADSCPKSIWFMQMMMLLLILVYDVCDLRVGEKLRCYWSVWCSFDLLCNRSYLFVCLFVHVCKAIDPCQWRHQPDQCISICHVII